MLQDKSGVARTPELVATSAATQVAVLSYAASEAYAEACWQRWPAAQYRINLTSWSRILGQHLKPLITWSTEQPQHTHVRSQTCRPK